VETDPNEACGSFRVSVEKLLHQLDCQWFRQRRGSLGSRVLARVWGLAVHERDKRLKGRVSDGELFSLTFETLNYCLPRFDPNKPPKTGSHGRRSVEDRFILYFRQKLVWELDGLAKWHRGDRGRRGDGRYRGPRESRGRGQWWAVQRALARLGEWERALIKMRYWEDEGFEAIAARLSLPNRYTAQRLHDRVLARLRLLVEDVA
jgi:hypothetical protein